jgi:urease alpha subunit
LGIDQKFGSLERGKVADVVLYDGDPFEYATHITHVILDGKLVYDRAAELSKPRSRSGGAVAGEVHCCEF